MTLQNRIGIFTKIRRNLGGSFPDDFIAWLEVLLGGESDLLMCDNLSVSLLFHSGVSNIKSWQIKSRFDIKFDNQIQ